MLASTRRTLGFVSHLALGALLCGPAFSAEPAAPSPCSDERAHQFDFWIGEWEVWNGEKLAGHNSIRPILDGCVLQETWTGAGGNAGSSFNFFDPQADRWRQLWVWRNGTTLELAGVFGDGRMVLEGTSTDGEGRTVRNRITWYDNPDGTVRQHWETAPGEGGSFETVFDGLYRKRAE